MGRYLDPTVAPPSERELRAMTEVGSYHDHDEDCCGHDHDSDECDFSSCYHQVECFGDCDCDHSDCCDSCHEHDEDCCDHECDVACCTHDGDCTCSCLADGSCRYTCTDGCDVATIGASCVHGHVTWPRFYGIG